MIIKSLFVKCIKLRHPEVKKVTYKHHRASKSRWYNNEEYWEVTIDGVTKTLHDITLNAVDKAFGYEITKSNKEDYDVDDSWIPYVLSALYDHSKFIYYTYKGILDEFFPYSSNWGSRNNFSHHYFKDWSALPELIKILNETLVTGEITPATAKFIAMFTAEKGYSSRNHDPEGERFLNLTPKDKKLILDALATYVNYLTAVNKNKDIRFALTLISRLFEVCSYSQYMGSNMVEVLEAAAPKCKSLKLKCGDEFSFSKTTSNVSRRTRGGGYQFSSIDETRWHEVFVLNYNGEEYILKEQDNASAYGHY